MQGGQCSLHSRKCSSILAPNTLTWETCTHGLCNVFSIETGTCRQPGSGVLHTDVGDLVSACGSPATAQHVPGRRQHPCNGNHARKTWVLSIAHLNSSNLFVGRRSGGRSVITKRPKIYVYAVKPGVLPRYISSHAHGFEGTSRNLRCSAVLPSSLARLSRLGRSFKNRARCRLKAWVHACAPNVVHSARFDLKACS